MALQCENWLIFLYQRFMVNMILKACGFLTSQCGSRSFSLCLLKVKEDVGGRYEAKKVYCVTSKFCCFRLEIPSSTQELASLVKEVVTLLAQRNGNVHPLNQDLNIHWIIQTCQARCFSTFELCFKLKYEVVDTEIHQPPLPTVLTLISNLAQ